MDFKNLFEYSSFKGGIFMSFKTHFASDIYHIRTDKLRLTQQQVADALGISRSAYAYYEIGGSEPSLSVLWELAQYFQVSADSLLDTSIK